MRDEINIELKEISDIVTRIGNNDVYTVPDNYFPTLADEILSRVQLPFIKTSFTPPDTAYFDNLASSILDKIKNKSSIFDEREVVKELKEASPFLASIGNANVYTIPQDYFSFFVVDVSGNKKNATVQLYKPVKWRKYAAAAVITGIVAVGGWLSLNKNNNEGDLAFHKKVQLQLSKFSDAAIASYIEDSLIDVMPSQYDESSYPVNLTEQLLKNVSNDDIQQYLEENVEPDEKETKGI